MGECQKVPQFEFQSQFSMSKFIGIFLNYFFIDEYQFRSIFSVIDMFEITLFSKMMPYF